MTRPKYMIRYQDADGRLLTGATIHDDAELIEAFAEVKKRPGVTVLWQECRSLNEAVNGGGEPNPWREPNEFPGHKADQDQAAADSPVLCAYYQQPGHTPDQRPNPLDYLGRDPDEWPLCPPCAAVAKPAATDTKV